MAHPAAVCARRAAAPPAPVAAGAPRGLPVGFGGSSAPGCRRRLRPATPSLARHAARVLRSLAASSAVLIAKATPAHCVLRHAPGVSGIAGLRSSTPQWPGCG